MAEMAIGLIGAGVSAMGSIMAGNAQAAMYNYQAQIATMNAGIAAQNAGVESAAGESQMAQEGEKLGQQKGATKAALGASGLALNQGSPQAVMESTDLIAEQDLSNIQYSASRRAYGDQIQETQDIAQAGLDRMGAQTAQEAGTIGAITSILGGGTSFASKWQQGQMVGLNPMGSGGLLGGTNISGMSL